MLMKPDHCIDHLRQTLQCRADLTPMEWQLEDDKIILRTDTLHTCVDFDAIRDWAAERVLDYSSKEEIRNGSRKIFD